MANEDQHNRSQRHPEDLLETQFSTRGQIGAGFSTSVPNLPWQLSRCICDSWWHQLTNACWKWMPIPACNTVRKIFKYLSYLIIQRINVLLLCVFQQEVICYTSKWQCCSPCWIIQLSLGRKGFTARKAEKKKNQEKMRSSFKAIVTLSGFLLRLQC